MMAKAESHGIDLVVNTFLMCLVSMWKAYVVMVLWNWFVPPLGLPALTYWHTFGINTLIAIVTWNRVPKRDEDSSWHAALWAAYAGSALYLIALGFGWVAHALMS